MWIAIAILAILGSILFGVFMLICLVSNEHFLTACSALLVVISVFTFRLAYNEMCVEKGQKNRVSHYMALKSNSSSIQNAYVKNIIKDTEKAIDEQYKNRAVFVTVPADFNSISRQNEYNQVVEILKTSGFQHIKDTTVGCNNNNHCPALVIY
ncbi:MAG: hypothetical protein IJ187_03635 [Neisseriaceae bacterium]|nr:hypothetical protein [Neisseriaceae bacterium]